MSLFQQLIKYNKSSKNLLNNLNISQKTPKLLKIKNLYYTIYTIWFSYTFWFLITPTF